MCPKFCGCVFPGVRFGVYAYSMDGGRREGSVAAAVNCHSSRISISCRGREREQTNRPFSHRLRIRQGHDWFFSPPERFVDSVSSSLSKHSLSNATPLRATSQTGSVPTKPLFKTYSIIRQTDWLPATSNTGEKSWFHRLPLPLSFSPIRQMRVRGGNLQFSIQSCVKTFMQRFENHTQNVLLPTPRKCYGIIFKPAILETCLEYLYTTLYLEHLPQHLNSGLNGRLGDPVHHFDHRIFFASDIDPSNWPIMAKSRFDAPARPF